MPMNGNQAEPEYRVMRIGVQGGIHEGAQSLLGAQQITVIGSAGDCDLCLRDTGIAAHHLAIGCSDGHFVVRPMDGQCSVNGERLLAGQSASIVCGDRIVLHDTGVSLLMAENPVQQTRIDGDTADHGREAGAPPHDERPLRRWTLYACVTLVTLGIALGSHQLLSESLPEPSAITNVTLLLESLEMTDAVGVSDESGIVTLSGVLQDDAATALEHALQTLPNDVVNRTQSVSRLLEQVRGVFRTNGYHAELTYAGHGGVQVTNLDGENPRIAQIAAHARDDVPVLHALTFAPVVDKDRSGRRLAAFSTDPDKRLTTIVDGDTAYVATSDGGRYFVGSVLPGGLVLRDISADGIQVDDNGEIHWFAL